MISKSAVFYTRFLNNLTRSRGLHPKEESNYFAGKIWEKGGKRSETLSVKKEPFSVL